MYLETNSNHNRARPGTVIIVTISLNHSEVTGYCYAMKKWGAYVKWQKQYCASTLVLDRQATDWLLDPSPRPPPPPKKEKIQQQSAPHIWLLLNYLMWCMAHADYPELQQGIAQAKCQRLIAPPGGKVTIKLRNKYHTCTSLETSTPGWLWFTYQKMFTQLSNRDFT